MPDESKREMNDQYFELAYAELQTRAHKLCPRRGAETLNATALLNETYMRIAKATNFAAESKEHLMCVVVEAMKHVLQDGARRKAALRRGGGSVPVRKLAVDQCASELATEDPRKTLAIALAVQELEKTDERDARMFKCRYFGGHSAAEIADIFGCTEKTVARAITRAKVKLAAALEHLTV